MEIALDLLLTTATAPSPRIIFRNACKPHREVRLELCTRGNRSRSYKVWVRAVQGWAVANVLTVVDGGRASTSR